MKQCKKCLETKPLNEFGKDKRVKSGLTARCKNCNNEAIYSYKKQNPHLSKNLHLLSRYGITLDTKQKMMEDQDNKCAICEKELNVEANTCVDHNHVTGEIRKILCSPCNKMLGHANENIQTLKNAIQYLTNHQP